MTDSAAPTEPEIIDRTDDILAALQAIPDHGMEEEELRHTAKYILEKIKVKNCNIDPAIVSLEKRVLDFHNALAQHGISITRRQAILALPSYIGYLSQTAAEKLAAFKTSFEKAFNKPPDLKIFFTSSFALYPICGLQLDKPLNNIVAQHRVLADAGMVLGAEEYAVHALTIRLTMARPETIADRGRFILEADTLGLLPNAKGESLTKKICSGHYLYCSSDNYAMRIIHERLAPFFGKIESKIRFRSLGITAARDSTRYGTEICAMLGGDPKKTVFKPLDAKEAQSPLKQYMAKKHALLRMLIEFHFVPGYSLHPDLVPDEVKAYKQHAYVHDTPQRHAQRYYAVEYFGEGADRLSIFELYKKIIASEQWGAVVEPARKMQERRHAQQAAAAITARQTQELRSAQHTQALGAARSMPATVYPTTPNHVGTHRPGTGAKPGPEGQG